MLAPIPLALVLVLVLGAVAQADINAPSSPFDGVEPGLNRAERALTVIPLEQAAPGAALPARVVDISSPQIAITTRGTGRPDRLFATDDTAPLRVLVPGLIIENDEKSFAVTEYAVARDGRGTQLALADLVSDVERDGTGIAFRTLPPTLRWMALTQPNNGEIRESLARWTRRWNAPGDDSTLTDLSRADGMERRIEGYVKPLLQLRATAVDRELVGYVALLGGDVAVVEVFGTAEDFSTHWPSSLRALAIEAILAERNEGWLKTGLHGDITPELGRSEVPALLARITAMATTTTRLGTELQLRSGVADAAAARMVTTSTAGRLIHAVYTPDATRRMAPDFDQIGPADDRTKGRSTGDVRRLGERRGERGLERDADDADAK